MAKYTYEEAYNAATAYFNGNETEARKWLDNIALKDCDGNVYELTPEYSFRRVSKQIAHVERKYPNPLSEEEIFKLICDGKFIILQDSLMAGAGNDYELNTLCGGVTIGSAGRDSIGGICKLEEELMQVMKRGGSVGYDISNIRPKGSSIAKSARRAAGLPALVNSLSNSVGEFGVESMRCFNIKHPDGESLLAPVKSPHHHWAMRIDDNFFKALMSNALYTQSFSRESSNYVVRKEVLASTLWSKITHFAASSDSPVLIFGDNAVKQSVPDCYKQFASIAISPESGLYMSSYESAATAEINIDNCDGCLDEIVAKAVRILDDIIDLELERIEKIIDKIHSDKECLEQKGTEIELWKKVKEQISFGRRIAISPKNEATIHEDDCKSIAAAAYRESIKLARERGKFKIYSAELEQNASFIQQFAELDSNAYMAMCQEGRRNIACLSPKRYVACEEAAALLKWTDQAVHQCLVLSEETDENIVGELLLNLWKEGCCACSILSSKTTPTSNKFPERPKYIAEEEHILKRPIELEADVVRFQNNKEKWIAFVGLINGRPYEIFTGFADDEEGIFCPKNINKGKIIKAIDENGNKRYDFQFVNKRGYKTTIEGLSDKFNPEFWNYAKLISGVLRYGMPINQVVKLVSGLELDNKSINTWKMGVERALKKYMPSEIEENTNN